MFMIERVNMVKMPILSKLIYKFDTIPVKALARFCFCTYRQDYPKILQSFSNYIERQRNYNI